MASEGLSTPSGMGGLLRYNEEYPSKLLITPQQVLILIGAVIVIMTLIKLFA